MVYETRGQVMSGAWEDLMAKVKAGQLPDTIGGLKTTDIIGFGAVSMAGLISFFMVRKLRKRRARRRRR